MLLRAKRMRVRQSPVGPGRVCCKRVDGVKEGKVKEGYSPLRVEPSFPRIAANLSVCGCDWVFYQRGGREGGRDAKNNGGGSDVCAVVR